MLLSFGLIAQTKTPKKFIDYPSVFNLDSFQSILNRPQKDELRYLNNLISFEKSRISFKSQFGSELETIRLLADKLNQPTAKAMFKYLQALYIKEVDIGLATKYCVEAIKYFEETKDTIGILNGYYGMLVLNGNSNFFENLKTRDPGYYYDKLLKLCDSSKHPVAKVLHALTTLYFEKRIKHTQNFQLRENE